MHGLLRDMPVLAAAPTTNDARCTRVGVGDAIHTHACACTSFTKKGVHGDGRLEECAAAGG